MEGVYTHTVKYEKDPACPMCSASVPFEVASTDSLEKVRHEHSRGKLLLPVLDHKHPSLLCCIRAPETLQRRRS